MGHISRKLARRFDTDRRGLQLLRKTIGKVPSGRKLSPDPVHAAYAHIQHVASVFAEAVSPLAELKPYYDAAEAAEDEYLPGGPPISPLTHSYFTMWAFFDLRFGRDDETIGTLLLDVGDRLGLSPEDFAVTRQFQHSRMGIYELRGVEDSRPRLRELITNKEFDCFAASGYVGEAGELWYVRVVPPIEGYDYHAAITTPYILQHTAKADWIAYLDRSLATLAGDNMQSKLHHMLKYGRHPNGWNEFISQAYCGFQSNAIFLAGIPDRPKTLPHGDMTGRRRCG